MRYWLSSKALTIEVTVSDHPNNFGQRMITQTPPIARKFIGQPIGNLAHWMEMQGNFRMEVINDTADRS